MLNLRNCSTAMVTCGSKPTNSSAAVARAEEACHAVEGKVIHWNTQASQSKGNQNNIYLVIKLCNIHFAAEYYICVLCTHYSYTNVCIYVSKVHSMYVWKLPD